MVRSWRLGIRGPESFQKVKHKSMPGCTARPTDPISRCCQSSGGEERRWPQRTPSSPAACRRTPSPTADRAAFLVREPSWRQLNSRLFGSPLTVAEMPGLASPGSPGGEADGRPYLICFDCLWLRIPVLGIRILLLG